MASVIDLGTAHLPSRSSAVGRTWVAACSVLLVGISLPAASVELVMEGTVAGIQSDNVSPGSPVRGNASLGVARIGAELRSESRRLSLDVDTDITHYEYFEGDFGSDTLPQISGEATWQLLPERLIWFFREELGQVGGQSFGELRPLVRENVNYFTTGPTLVLPLGGRNSLEVSATYSAVDYSGFDLDSTRYEGTAQLRRRLSERRSLSGVYSYTKIDYRNLPSFDGYDRNVASLRLESTARRGSLLIEGGVSQVSRPMGGEESAPLFNFEIQRQIGAHNTLGFQVSTQSSDAAEAFRDGIGTSISPGGEVASPLTAAPYVLDSSVLGWSYDATRLAAQFRAAFERERYDDQVIADRDRVGGTFSVRYRWNSRSETAAAVTHERNSSDDPAYNDKNWAFDLSYSHRIVRDLYGTISYTRFERDRDFASASEAENRWMLTLAFRPAPFTIGRPLGSGVRSRPGDMRRRSIGGDLTPATTSEPAAQP
ncbi:MAG: hypothetical protein KDI23_00060 [Pseudomonadales bacterium]|nr:hypothetical protein [Pseudomonadales bacterium]